MSGHIATISKDVDAIKTALFPTDSTQTRSHLSACNVHSRFTRKFSKNARLFYDYLRKDRELD